MITPMKKVMLAGRRRDCEAVLHLLRETGVVHVEPVRPESVQVSCELLQQIERAAKALEALKEFVPADGTDAPQITAADAVEQVDAHLSRLARLHDEKKSLEQEIERLSPWGRLGTDELAALAGGGMEISLFSCPLGRETSIEAELSQIVARKGGVSYGVAVSRQPILWDDDVTPVDVPERDAEELRQAVLNIAREESGIREALGTLSLKREAIRAHLKELEDSRRFYEVESGLMKDGPVYVLQGWAPEPAIPALQEALKASDHQTCLQIFDPREEEHPPTLLKNAWWCKSIESLYALLGLTPGYREVDISPFFMPFLTIFTAMIFTDAGYGLVGLVGLVAFYKPLTAKGVRRDVLHLFMILFSAAFVYGLLTNSFFGTTYFRLDSFDEESTRGQNLLMRVCFLLGAVQISIAHLWKVRRLGMVPASLAQIGWVCFTWAIWALVNVLVLGTPVPPWMIPLLAIALGLIIIFTAPSRNIFLGLGKGFGAVLHSAVSFFADVISYVRLMAVALATGILAMTFNGMARHIPVEMDLIFLPFVHTLNIALCLVAIFAHGVRLNLLEFSNHLGMEWSGSEYEPFAR